MSSFTSPETIPVDSLVVSRKIMKDSKLMLEQAVQTVVDQEGISKLPISIKSARPAAMHITKRDYLKQKLSHPRLGIYSTVALTERFNSTLNYERGALNDFAYNIGIDDAHYEEVKPGAFVVGLEYDEAGRNQAAAEQTMAIDKLLDAADISPDDPIREWRNNAEDSLWLPVAELRATDPALEGVVEYFAGKLGVVTSGMSVSFFNAQARTSIVNASQTT